MAIREVMKCVLISIAVATKYHRFSVKQYKLVVSISKGERSSGLCWVLCLKPLEAKVKVWPGPKEGSNPSARF